MRPDLIMFETTQLPKQQYAHFRPPVLAVLLYLIASLMLVLRMLNAIASITTGNIGTIIFESFLLYAAGFIVHRLDILVKYAGLKNS